jgi:anthranilate/para-aminobenzoate synthase component II
VQFHPESILTMENNHGLRLIGNLLAAVTAAYAVA